MSSRACTDVIGFGVQTHSVSNDMQQDMNRLVYLVLHLNGVTPHAFQFEYLRCLFLQIAFVTHR